MSNRTSDHDGSIGTMIESTLRFVLAFRDATRRDVTLRARVLPPRVLMVRRSTTMSGMRKMLTMMMTKMLPLMTTVPKKPRASPSLAARRTAGVEVGRRAVLMRSRGRRIRIARSSGRRARFRRRSSRTTHRQPLGNALRHGKGHGSSSGACGISPARWRQRGSARTRSARALL